MKSLRLATLAGLFAFSAAACSGSTEPGAITQIVPSTTRATLLLGDTFHLTASPEDAKGIKVSGQTLVWTSGNSAIATVNSTGAVTAVAPGTTTVTVTDGSLSAQITIIVVTLSSQRNAPVTLP